jgi:hypothetical protein
MIVPDIYPLGILFIKKTVDKTFDGVLISLSPCLATEGFRMMTDIKAQNEYRERNNEGFRRFVIFENRLNSLLEQPEKPTGDPALRMASNFTLRETDSGGTEIVGFDPTLPSKVDEEDLGTSRRDARHLRSRVEDALGETAANS